MCVFGGEGERGKDESRFLSGNTTFRYPVRVHVTQYYCARCTLLVSPCTIVIVLGNPCGKITISQRRKK